MSTLIGLGGKLRAGKDAAADYLADTHGYHKLGMSDALNEALLKLNPWITGTVPNAVSVFGEEVRLTPIRYQELHDAVGYVQAKTFPEVRRLLQVLGTEVGRDMIGQDVWVNIAEKRIKALLDAGVPVVITAVRFPNELEMIRKLGGTAVWIERASEARGASEEVSGHASEQSVSMRDFPRAIGNHGTLEELYVNVEALIENIDSSRAAGYRDHWPVYDR